MGQKLKKAVPKAEPARTGSVFRRLSNRSRQRSNSSISSSSSSSGVVKPQMPSSVPVCNGTLSNEDSRGRGQTSGNLKFGPLEDALREPIMLLSNASEAIQTIVKILQKYKEEVGYVKDNYEQNREKDKIINELRISLRNITLIRNEETNDLRDQVANLTEGKAACDNEKEEYRRLTNELNAKAAEAETKSQEQLARRKVELDNEYSKKVTDLQTRFKKEREKLEEENEKKIQELKQQKKDALEEINKLKDELKAKDKRLAEKKDRYAHERTGLQSRNASLQAELDQWEREFAVNALSSEDCAIKFRKLSDDINRVAKSYAGNLPDKFKEPKAAEELRKRLSELDPVFEWTPISETNDSLCLRTSDIEHVISRNICETAWQPFSSEAASSYGGARALLSNVSDQLFEISGNVESTWRTLTLRGLDKLDGHSSESLANDVVDKVLHILEPLFDSADLDKQRHKLTEIVGDAVDLWNGIQRDRYRVAVETEPNQMEDMGWASPYPKQTAQNPPPLNEAGLKHICLFPKVQRIDPSVGTPTILIQGRAIFADSPILASGIAERDEIQNDIRQEEILRAAEEHRERQRELEDIYKQLTNNGNSRGRHSRNVSLASPSPIYPDEGHAFGNVAVMG